jgi:hypothetical protein
MGQRKIKTTTTQNCRKIGKEREREREEGKQKPAIHAHFPANGEV